MYLSVFLQLEIAAAVVVVGNVGVEVGVELRIETAAGLVFLPIALVPAS